MCSLQSVSEANFGIYPSEQLEDDFITNLFSQNITMDNCPNATFDQTYANQNAVQGNSSYLLANQIDHDYAGTVSSTLLSPAWEEPATQTFTRSLNMSTYFSTFNPSAQFETSQLYPVMQHKPNNAQAMGKIHRARINLVPTTAGNIKAIKRKRKRTIFRTDQVEAMEQVFAKKPYVTKEDRQVLVEKLHVSDKSIKVWFQNRRLKNKRDDEQYVENDSSPDFDRLDYVEAKIHERTNSLGYVTLDDGIMRDIVQVIDEYLNNSRPDNSNNDIRMEITDITKQVAKETVESIPVYEPISPASTTDCSYDENSWESQYPEKKEYLQTLIDIDSIIAE